MTDLLTAGQKALPGWKWTWQANQMVSGKCGCCEIHIMMDNIRYVSYTAWVTGGETCSRFKTPDAAAEWLRNQIIAHSRELITAMSEKAK